MLSIHDIVRVVSNYPFIGFRGDDDANNVTSDIVINVGDFDFQKNNLSKLDFWYYGKDGGDFVYYEDKILFMSDRILLKNLSGKTELYVSHGSLKMDRLYTPRSRGSIRKLIDAIIQIKQIEHGCLSIHASCLSRNGEAVLLAAFPNVGKTLSAHQLLKEGFEYLSDDTILVDSRGMAYLTSFPSAVGYYDFLRFIKPSDIGVLRYGLYFIKSWIMHKNKLLNRILKPPHIALGDLYKTVNKSKVKVVCTLEIGPKAIKRVDEEYIFKKIKAINEYCLPRFYNNPFIKVYDYFNLGYVDSIKEQENANLLDFLSGCECYCLACNDWNWKSLLSEIGIV